MTTSTAKPLAPPMVAIVGYTLRACLPAKRWLGVLLPAAGAVFFGWLSTVLDYSNEQQNFATVAEQGLFGLVLPLACLVIGDAVVASDVRAGTFQLTWLSPVRFPTLVVGRWFGGWLIALTTLLPAFVLAAVVPGRAGAIGPLLVAVVAGSAAYLAVFVLLGVLVRRAAVWALALVFLGERMLGAALSGVGQLSPLWQAQQTFAGLWDHGPLIERSGMPAGWSAAARLVLVTVVCLAVASWRVAHMRPVPDDS